MDAEALRDHLAAEFGPEGPDYEISYELLTVTVPADRWRPTAEFVRRDPEVACNFFDFLCGVDEEAAGIGVVLHVSATLSSFDVWSKPLKN